MKGVKVLGGLKAVESNLLKQLEKEERGLTIYKLAQVSGHSWSTTRFYLFQLKEKGLVECLPSDKLSVGGHLDLWRRR